MKYYFIVHSFIKTCRKCKLMICLKDLSWCLMLVVFLLFISHDITSLVATLVSLVTICVIFSQRLWSLYDLHLTAFVNIVYKTQLTVSLVWNSGYSVSLDDNNEINK